MNDIQAGALSILLAGLGIRIDDVINQLAHCLLKTPVTLNTTLYMSTVEPKLQNYTRLFIIWAMVSISEPCGLSEWHLAELAWSAGLHHARLALDCANLETRILRALEDLMAM